MPLQFEWKPVKCNNCKNFGHHEEMECRLKKARKIWVPKVAEYQPAPLIDPGKKDDVVIGESTEVEGYPDGFQRALKPIIVRVRQITKTHTQNTFQTLEQEEGKGEIREEEVPKVIHIRKGGGRAS